jgi:hypothetical protein
VEALEKGRRRKPVSVLPDTATKRTHRRRWPGYALAAVGLAALLLAAVALLQERSFSPGEKLYAPGFEDIAVSTEDASYPSSDALRFDLRPEVVYVYVAVEDLPRDSDLDARVEHSSRESALSQLLGGGESIEVLDGREERLGPSGDGVSGVVKFAIRAEAGELLPAGNYTVSIYASPERTEGRDPAAIKYFVIQG